MASRRVSQRKIAVVEWTSALLGIPWSVWWGFFVHRWMESTVNSIPLFGREFNMEFFMVISTFIIGIFILAYVNWLWEVTQWGRRVTFIRVSRKLLIMVAWLVGFAVAIHLVQNGFNLENNGYWYGVSLTLIWIISPAVQTIFF